MADKSKNASYNPHKPVSIKQLGANVGDVATVTPQDLKHYPAKGIACAKCHFMGHFAQHCRTKSLQEVTAPEELFLGTITCADESEPEWRKTLETQGGFIDFKLDSGVDVTVIPA